MINENDSFRDWPRLLKDLGSVMRLCWTTYYMLEHILTSSKWFIQIIFTSEELGPFNRSSSTNGRRQIFLFNSGWLVWYPTLMQYQDSITALFRVDFSGRGELAERQQSE